MSQSAHKPSCDSMTAALVAAAGEQDLRPGLVGIWVVWLHAGRPIHVESASRLNGEGPVVILLDADEAVLVVMAPRQVADRLHARIHGIHQYLADKGVPTSTVHLHPRAEGASWISVCGSDGRTATPRTAPHSAPCHSVLPRPKQQLSRGLLAALTPMVALCAATFTHTALETQPARWQFDLIADITGIRRSRFHPSVLHGRRLHRVTRTGACR